MIKARLYTWDSRLKMSTWSRSHKPEPNVLIFSLGLQAQGQALIARRYSHSRNIYEKYSLTSMRCSDPRTMQDLISAWLIHGGQKQEMCCSLCLRAADTEEKSCCRKDVECSHAPDFLCRDKLICNTATPGLVSNFCNDSFLKIHLVYICYSIQITNSGY